MVLHSPLESRTPVVTACSRKARQCGVRPGLTLAEARTLAPTAWFAIHDPEADHAALRTLAWQCHQFTPRSGLEPAESPDSLFLDVTGCVHLFGDLQTLGTQVSQHFEQQGYFVHLAVAPTFGAAWGLARYGRRVQRFADRRSARSSATSSTRPAVVSTFSTSALTPLPLAALRLPEETLALLAECGIRTIGQLIALPRSTLPARFGQQLLCRLDQAWGDSDELLQPEIPPEPVHGQARFEFPLTDADAVLHVLRGLLEKVLAQLKQRLRLTQQLLINWKTEAAETGGIEVRLLRPTTSPDRLWELITLKFERVQLPSGVLELQLEALPCRSETLKKRTLFESDDAHAAEFLNLVERLSSRLGEDAVVSHRPVPESQPELACLAVPWISRHEGRDTHSETPDRSPGMSLPCRLLKSPVPVYVICPPDSSFPQRFHWQNREHLVALCEGPQRLSTGWWRTASAKRDYFRIETMLGTRFWLFKALDSGHWFLHGIYD